ncbi:MAG TPA: hypothetical protein VGU90_15905, partial [Terriglobales bacterium]|nr:hypothetical protein [Terriglobales bacterium]
ADSTPAKPQRAINPEAHDAYLQGRYLWFAENGDRGRQYFEKAIQLQPDYAAAWAGLGDSYGEQAAAGEIPPNEGFAKVEENARKALALDSTLPEGHNSMAALYLLNKWDWRQAEVESLRAIELDPNYAEARFIHSLLLLVMNRDDEALEEEKRSNGISPFERPWALGGLYNSLRQYDAAINELQSRANTQQQNAYIHFLLSEVYWLKGRWNDSERELEAAYRLWGNPNLADAVRRAFMRGGGEAVRKLELANILRSSRTQYVPPFSIAVQYAYLRDKEHTLNFLEAACRERSPSVIFLQRDPLFDFLRSDERYRALIRNIGLPLAN